MIVVESLINNVTYVVELSDVSSLSISQAIAAKNISELVLEQVNNQKAAIETIQALVQDLRDQSEAFWTSSGESASSALANKNATDVNLAQTLSALNSAVQVAMGQATGIAGIIPTARIRANSAFLNPEFTITRGGSSATFFNANMRLVTAPANSPRFEFDPRTGEALGLLIESQKTNFLIRSNDFGNPSWLSKQNSTVVPNSGISVDGENNAWLLRESSDSAAFVHFVGGNFVTINAGTEYTFSIFAKAATRSNLLIALPGTATWAGSTSELQFSFNLIAGTVTRTQGSGGAGSIQNLGNGWYRCSVTVTATASSTTDPRFVLESSTGVRAYVGDGTSGLLIYGAQVEVGDVSSYIPTTSSAATRNRDSCPQSLASINQNEGTIILRVRRNSVSACEYFDFFGPGGAPVDRLGLISSGIFQIRVGGVIYPLSAGSSGIGIFDIYVISYTRTRVAVSRNGGAINSVNIPNLFQITGVAFDVYGTSNSKHIHTYQYIPKALTDAQLIVRSNPATFFGFENGDVALNADLGNAAFVNVNAIQRLPSRSDIPFLGTGAAAQRIFSLDFASTLQLVHLPAGGTYSVSAGTTVVPGTTVIPAGTNITVDFNVANNNVLILAFLPAIQ